MVLFERASKPAIPIVSHGFETMVDTTAKVRGLPQLQYVVVPLNYKSLTPEQAIVQTEPVMDDILRHLTSVAEQPETAGGNSVGVEKIQFHGVDRFEACERFNEAFLRNDWGDGYPLLPPTEERVREILRGTTRKPDDVVCIFPPANGVATVEKIAINAAMAGCRPEHLPVLMAGLRAFLKIHPVWLEAFQTSTSSQAPLFMLNGPIAQELGVNGGRCCLGPGRDNAVNITIGRAFTLAIRNIGQLYPGITDMDTIGSPRKFSFCLAENEKESPWEPFQVEHGYSKEASTITIFSTLGERDVAFQGHLSVEHLLRQISTFIDAGNSERFLGFRGESAESEKGRLLLLPPIHAQALADGGFSKKAVKEFLYHTVTQPAKQLLQVARKMQNKVLPQWRWLAELPESEAEKIFLPVVESPELYHIVVAGSDRPKPAICPIYCLPSTLEITDRA